MTDEKTSNQNWKPKTNPWIVAATVALAAFMEVLDSSIANVALPHIAGSLAVSNSDGNWVLTSYLVSNAIVLPIGAWASSVIGRKNFFLLCIAIFTVASFLCGIAPTLGILLLARVIQGAGGGGLQPMAQAIMADSFDESKRGQAFALYGLVAVLAPSIGPPVGGWITDNFSWRWIFYINIPIGILASILVTRYVEDPPWIKASLKNLKTLDYTGLSFLIIAMGGMQIMLDKGEENAWLASSFVRTFAALFVIGMVGLIWREWLAKDPIINIKLFKHRNFAICSLLMLLIGGVLNAGTVLLPQYTQQVVGYTATLAGQALILGGVLLLILMPLGGIASGKYPARNLAAGGFACFALAFYYTSTHVTLQIGFGTASLMRLVQMAPFPFCFVAVTNAAYIGLPREASNQISGLINFARNIGGSIFISATSAVEQNRALFHQARLGSHMNMGNPVFANRLNALTTTYNSVSGLGQDMAQTQIYNQMNTQASVLGYADVYRMLCWVCVGMFFCALLLSKNKPGEGAPSGEGMA